MYAHTDFLILFNNYSSKSFFLFFSYLYCSNAKLKVILLLKWNLLFLELENIGCERKIEDTNLNLYLTRIDKNLDVILDLLKHHTSSNNNYSSMTDTTFLNNFPVNDVETMQQLDEMFKKDQEYMTKLVIKQNT